MPVILHPNTNNLTGKRFGRLIAIEPYDRRLHYIRWKCVCDCGNTTIVRSSSLTGGNTKSCGCLFDENPPPIMRGKDNPRWRGGVHIRKVKSIICPDCGKVRLVRVDHINRDGFTSKCRKCSIKSNTKSGENYHNWKGGQGNDRDSWKMKKWREFLYKRDGYSCQICGSKKNINAHHIKSYTEYPELRFDINNGITVCWECHKDIHWGIK